MSCSLAVSTFSCTTVLVKQRLRPASLLLAEMDETGDTIPASQPMCLRIASEFQGRHGAHLETKKRIAFIALLAVLELRSK